MCHVPGIVEQATEAAAAELWPHVAIAAQRSAHTLPVERQHEREVRRAAGDLATLARDPGQRAARRVLIVQPRQPRRDVDARDHLAH
jgi:hypothetical protein